MIIQNPRGKGSFCLKVISIQNNITFFILHGLIISITNLIPSKHKPSPSKFGKCSLVKTRKFQVLSLISTLVLNVFM